MNGELMNNGKHIEAMRILHDKYGTPVNQNLINYDAYTSKEFNHIFNRPDLVEYKENSIICEDEENCFIYIQARSRKYHNTSVCFNPNNQLVTANSVIIAGLIVKNAIYVPYEKGYASSYGVLLIGK